MSAAISAGDLALAMSRANNSARLAGADMNKFIGYVTTVADVTQKSAESVGESFKTIFSRFGNVKAGKFVASQEEMDLPDYDEAEFENLNDIETVLDSIGIKIRDNYSTWRDIDDILAEIGKKWNTWDTTTQNAVATAIAGTRQRENVLTLFSNWEDVSKYAEIAENAYGTATKKMEAYSDSIDAAKNRLSAALEKIVLDLNNFEVIKDFYNVMTFIVTNLKTLIPILTGYIAITRSDSLAQSFGGVAEKLTSRLMNLGLSNNTAQSNGKAAIGIFGNMKKNIGENLTQGYLMAQEQAYAQSLSRYTISLNDREAQNIRTLQSEILSMEATDKKIIAEQLLVNTYNEEALASLTEDQQRRIATILYTQVVDQNTANILRQIALGGNLTEAQLAEIDARGGVTRLLYEEMNNITKNNNIRKQMSNNLQSSLNTNKSSVLSATLAGVGSLGGGLLGGSIGNNLANAYGLSGTGQVALMTGGSLLGSFGLKALGAGAGTLLGGGTASAASSAALAAVGMTNPAGWFAIGAAIVGLVIAGIKSAAKKKEQEIANAAREAFLEASETYNNDKNMLASVKKYDELAKGVNEFGENISLTEEDYSTFIELTNKLAEQFPDLITYTDEAENKFIGLGGSIGGVTEAVESLIKAEQKDADQKLLKTELLNSQQSEYSSEFNKYSTQLNALRYLKNNLNNMSNLGILDTDIDEAFNKSGLVAGEDYQKNVYGNKHSYTIKNIDKLDTLISNLEKSIQELQGSYIDTYMAMLRQNQGKDETGAIIDTASILEGMSNNEISILTQAIKGAGLDFSSETIANDVAEIALHTSEILGKMSEEATEIARKKQEDYATIGAYDDAQRKLANLVAKELTVGSDGLFNSVDRALITNTYGLRIRKDGNDDEGYHEYIAPNDNLFQQLLRETNYGYGVSGYRDYMKNLSFSDAKILKDLNDSGILQYLDNTDDWTRLILNERGYGDDIYSKRSYYNDQREQNKAFKEAFTNDMNGYIDSSKPTVLGNLSDNDINKMYGKYGLQIAKAIKNSRDEIEKAIKDGVNGEELQELYNSEIEKIFASSDLLESNANIEVIKQTLADTFADVDLGTEGLISSFAELKEVLDSVYESLDRLKSAQEEQAATGQLSVETVLSLLAADESYLSVLQAENGVITLVNGAEEIMAANKLAAAQAGMAEMRASMLKEAAQIQEALTTNELIENTDAEVQSSINAVNASDTLSTAMIKETKAALEAAKGHIELNNARNGNGNMAAIEKLEANVESIVNSVSAVATDVSKISTTSRKLNESDIESLKHRWEQLTGVSAEDAFSTTYIYEDSSGRTITSDKPIDINRYTLVDQKTIINDGYNLIGNDGKNFKWGTQGYIPTLDNLMNSTTITNPTKFWSNYKHDSSSNKGSSGKETTPDEILKAIESAINKEYEAMIAWDKTLLTGVEHETEYFTKMRGVLEREKEYYASLIESGTLTEKERLETEQKLIEAEVKLRNLDDEEIKDKIKILELQNADKKVIVEQYRTLVKTADTLEEALEYQKQLYEAMRDEVSTRLQIAEAQEKSAKDTLSMYEELSALSGQRLVSSQFAHDYVTNSDATGNAWLDRQREALHENSQEWMEIAELLKNPELSEEEKEQYKARQDLLHETNALIRESMGYDGGIDGSDYIDLTDGSQKGTEKNQLEHQQDLQKEREQNRQIIENIISKFETQNVAYELINQQLYRLLDFAQNEEQQLDILERIEENQRAQYDLIKGIKEFQTTKNDFELEYLNPYLNSERYNYLKDQNKQMYKEIQQNAKTEYARLWNKIYNDNIAAGATAEQASQAAYGNSDVQAALQDYMDAYKAYGDVVVSVIEDKLEHIQRKLDKIEKSKPQEWASIRQIEKFATNEIALYQQKLDVLWEQLKDIKDITDEQIKYMIDEYNDAFKAIHDMRIQALSDKLGYQDNILEAIRFAVDTQIKDLELQRDIIEKIYDDELKKLKDKEASYERTNKLIELQNKLLDTNKEKERVYRQGIGWVYETDRTKLKTAQQNLDNFYRQDRIDDLEVSKQNDIQRIADEIEGWQDYLEALEWQYEQWQHEENMRLLKEVLGVESDQEVYDLLKEDMKAYREYRKNAIDGNQMFADIKTGITGKIESLGQNFDWLGNRVVVLGQEVDGVVKYFTYSIEEANKLFGLQINKWLESGLPFWQWLMEGFDGVFKHFLNEHYENEEEYHELMREELPLLDDKNFLRGNELPTTWDSPTNSTSTIAKKIGKEYYTLWDIVQNDRDVIAQKLANGEDVFGFSSHATMDDAYMDYSEQMYQAAKHGDWATIALNAALRTEKAENLDYDITGKQFKENAYFIVEGVKEGLKENTLKGEDLQLLADNFIQAADIASITNTTYGEMRNEANKLFSNLNETVELEGGYIARITTDALGNISTQLETSAGAITRNLTKEEAAMVRDINAKATLNKEGLVTTLTNLNDKELIADLNNSNAQVKIFGKEGENTRGVIVDANNKELKGLSTNEMAVLGVQNMTKNLDNNNEIRQNNANKMLQAFQELTGSFKTQEDESNQKTAAFNSELSYWTTTWGAAMDGRLDDEMIPKFAELVVGMGEQLGLSRTQETSNVTQDKLMSYVENNTDALVELYKKGLQMSGASQAEINAVTAEQVISKMAASGDFMNGELETIYKGASLKGMSDADVKANQAVANVINEASDKWWSEQSKIETLTAQLSKTSDATERQSIQNQITQAKVEQFAASQAAYAAGTSVGWTRENGSWSAPETSNTTSGSANSTKTITITTSGGDTSTYTGSSSTANRIAELQADIAKNSASWWTDPTNRSTYEQANKNNYAELSRLTGNNYYIDAGGAWHSTSSNNNSSSSYNSSNNSSNRSSNSSSGYSSGSSSSSSSSSDSGSSYNAYNTSSSYHSSYASSEVNNNARSGTSQSAKDSAAATIAEAKAEWAAAAARGDSAAAAAAHDKAEAARNSVGYQTDSSGRNARAYASGIEKGPVTYTGLAMLHGTPSEPEYVLNSDQAYNVLKYIATGNRPKDNIESYNNNTNKTTQYIVEGDIVLEGIDNPAEFWDGVTTAMSNRWNVTKNK